MAGDRPGGADAATDRAPRWTARFAADVRETGRSLRVRNFRLFIVGQVISQIGTWMQMLAVPWLVYEVTGSGVYLGLTTTIQYLPVLLLGAWAGLLSDRVDRHRLLLATQFALLAVAFGYTVLTFTGSVNIGAIFVLAAANGVVIAVENPTRRVVIGELVDEGDVANAVGLASATTTASRLLGPGLASVLLASGGMRWCFAVNTVSYIGVIVALLRMDRSKIRSGPRVAKAKGQLREGFRYVAGQRELLVPIILLAVVAAFAFEFQVTLPLLSERAIGGDGATFSLLFGALGLGSLAGCVVVARTSNAGTLFLARCARWLGLAMVLLALSPNVPFALAAMVPVGALVMALISGATAVVQLRAEPAMRGRATALVSIVLLGCTPIVAPIIGWIGENVGARASILVGAVASLAVGVWGALAARAPVAAPAHPPALAVTTTGGVDLPRSLVQEGSPA